MEEEQIALLVKALAGLTEDSTELSAALVDMIKWQKSIGTNDAKMYEATKKQIIQAKELYKITGNWNTAIIKSAESFSNSTKSLGKFETAVTSTAAASRSAGTIISKAASEEAKARAVTSKTFSREMGESARAAGSAMVGMFTKAATGILSQQDAMTINAGLLKDQIRLLDKGVQAGASAMGKLGDSIAATGGKYGKYGTALSGLSKMVGTLSGAMSDLATQGIQFLLTAAKQLMTDFSSMSASGVMYANGLKGMTDAAQTAGLSLTQLSEAAAKHGDQFTSSGYSMSEGTRKMAKVMQQSKVLIDESGRSMSDQMLALGIGFEEQAALTARMMQMDRVSANGKVKSDAELAQQTLEYAKNLKSLSDIAGKGVEKELEEARLKSQEADIRNQLKTKEQKMNFDKAYVETPKELRAAFLEKFSTSDSQGRNGQTVDAKAATYLNQNNDANKAMEFQIAGIKQGMNTKEFLAKNTDMWTKAGKTQNESEALASQGRTARMSKDSFLMGVSDIGNSVGAKGTRDADLGEKTVEKTEEAAKNKPDEKELDPVKIAKMQQEQVLFQQELALKNMGQFQKAMEETNKSLKKAADALAELSMSTTGKIMNALSDPGTLLTMAAEIVGVVGLGKWGSKLIGKIGGAAPAAVEGAAAAASGAAKGAAAAEGAVAKAATEPKLSPAQQRKAGKSAGEVFKPNLPTESAKGATEVVEAAAKEAAIIESEAAKSAGKLATVGKLALKAGPVLKVAGKVAGPLAGVLSVAEGSMVAYEGYNAATDNKGKGAALGKGSGMAAGGLGGAALGAGIGGAIGTVLIPIPGVGTGVGMVVGSVISGWLGAKGGEIVGEAVGGAVGGSLDETKSENASKKPAEAAKEATKVTAPTVSHAEQAAIEKSAKIEKEQLDTDKTGTSIFKELLKVTKLGFENTLSSMKDVVVLMSGKGSAEDLEKIMDKYNLTGTGTSAGAGRLGTPGGPQGGPGSGQSPAPTSSKPPDKVEHSAPPGTPTVPGSIKPGAGVGAIAGTTNLGGTIGNLTEAESKAYAATVAKRESSGNIGIVNSLGYSGKYQFGAEALADTGVLDKQRVLAMKKAGMKNKDIMADESLWKNEGGRSAFLKDEKLQDETFRKYTNANLAGLKKMGVLGDNSSKQDTAGYLMAAHLKGVGGARDLSRGMDNADAYGTKASDYYKIGAKSLESASESATASANAIAKAQESSKVATDLTKTYADKTQAEQDAMKMGRGRSSDPSTVAANAAEMDSLTKRYGKTVPASQVALAQPAEEQLMQHIARMSSSVNSMGDYREDQYKNQQSYYDTVAANRGIMPVQMAGEIGPDGKRGKDPMTMGFSNIVQVMNKVAEFQEQANSHLATSNYIAEDHRGVAEKHMRAAT